MNKQELTLNEIKNYIYTVAEENGFPKDSLIVSEALLNEIKYIVEKYKLPFITHLNFKFSKNKKTGYYKVVPIIPARARIGINANKIKRVDIEIFEKEEKLKATLERKDGAVFSGIYYLSEYYNENSLTWREKKWKMLQLRAVNDLIAMYVDDYTFDEEAVFEEYEIETDENVEERRIPNESNKNEIEELRDKAFYKLTELIGTEEEAANFIDSENVDMENVEILKWILDEKNEAKLVNRIKKYFEKKRVA